MTAEPWSLVNTEIACSGFHPSNIVLQCCSIGLDPSHIIVFVLIPNKNPRTSLPHHIKLWLVVWNITSIFPYIGNNHPNWLCFRGVGQPPTRTTQKPCRVSLVISRSLAPKTSKNLAGHPPQHRRRSPRFPCDRRGSQLGRAKCSDGSLPSHSGCSRDITAGSLELNWC